MEIGIDCVEINRFADQGTVFFKRVFTDREINYCENKGKPLQHYAGKFAGKEAVIKALHPFGVSLDVGKIEILNDEFGRPVVNLACESPDSYIIKISLSHSNSIAMAVAVAVRKSG